MSTFSVKAELYDYSMFEITNNFSNPAHNRDRHVDMKSGSDKITCLACVYRVLLI